MGKGENDQEFDFFEINPNRLDEEWLRHPKLYHKHAIILADARKEYEQKKAELEVLSAEIDRAIRSTPSEFGLEKITETVVANTILIQPPYRKLQKEVIEAKHDVAVAEAAVSTMEHRKKALENAVQLHLADYFSEPKARGSAREKMEEEKKRRIRNSGRERREEE